MYNELHIYSSKRFHVNECGFVEDAPCKQVINFWNFRTLENAVKKLKELWKNYKTYDHRNSFPFTLWGYENLEADNYSD